MSDKYVSCAWSCSKCRQKGTVAVWVIPNSTDDLALRHQNWTRLCCVKDCQYIARQKEEAVHQ